jgi:hypothetical protein
MNQYRYNIYSDSRTIPIAKLLCYKFIFIGRAMSVKGVAYTSFRLREVELFSTLRMNFKDRGTFAIHWYF